MVGAGEDVEDHFLKQLLVVAPLCKAGELVGAHEERIGVSCEV